MRTAKKRTRAAMSPQHLQSRIRRKRPNAIEIPSASPAEKYLPALIPVGLAILPFLMAAIAITRAAGGDRLTYLALLQNLDLVPMVFVAVLDTLPLYIVFALAALVARGTVARSVAFGVRSVWALLTVLAVALAVFYLPMDPFGRWYTAILGVAMAIYLLLVGKIKRVIVGWLGSPDEAFGGPVKPLLLGGMTAALLFIPTVTAPLNRGMWLPIESITVKSFSPQTGYVLSRKDDETTILWTGSDGVKRYKSDDIVKRLICDFPGRSSKQTILVDDLRKQRTVDVAPIIPPCPVKVYSNTVQVTVTPPPR
ncbi:hypothetical protein [Paractinoplanes abujensis]|uniref:Uncharacterized protein n=1 Tax=Paractinoplanes abujensis TaxID=882441 RepID=A0A7W7G4L3_9ACTN|nr:hypothetical protein [Actinoplanes abujensis]MBB4695410.1 hypothetical protein [Actinoplanes abujensis]